MKIIEFGSFITFSQPSSDNISSNQSIHVFEPLSLHVFRSISSNIALCLSIKPLEKADSASFLFIVMLQKSHISLQSSLQNSPILSLKNLDGAPKMLIHVQSRCFIISFLSFNFTTAAAENLLT